MYHNSCPRGEERAPGTVFVPRDAVTLRMNTDFRRAYMRGKSYTYPALVVYVSRNRAGLCRYGISASKKIGNAVQRNRARRVIRAAFTGAPLTLRPGYDLVFVARSKTVRSKSTELVPLITEALLASKAAVA